MVSFGDRIIFNANVELSAVTVLSTYDVTKMSEWKNSSFLEFFSISFPNS